MQINRRVQHMSTLIYSISPIEPYRVVPGFAAQFPAQPLQLMLIVYRQQRRDFGGADSIANCSRGSGDGGHGRIDDGGGAVELGRVHAADECQLRHRSDGHAVPQDLNGYTERQR
eukprot:6184735-Pleurochrysis_carterae.AAC.4